MWQQYTYKDTGGNRPYFVYTPVNYQVRTAVPLLVMLHGCTQTALDFATGTSMNLLAEQYGFIVLYPQQTSMSNQNLCWNWFTPANQYRGSGEPASIVGMIQAIQQDTTHWTIDPSHIYVAGLSAGGAMAVILGVTYPDLFAAIGVHSGLEYQAATNVSSGLKAMRRGGPDPLQQGRVAYNAMNSFSRIVPTIVFHGTNDGVAAPINGDQVIQQWMQTDQLASNGSYTADFTQPASVTPGQVPNGRSYTTTTWNATNGDEVQSYWKIARMKHAWSGGNPGGSFTDPQGPNASLAMYNFFMAHPLRSANHRVLSQRRKNSRFRRILADLFDIKRERRRA